MSDIYFVAWPIAFQALVSHDTRVFCKRKYNSPPEGAQRKV